MKKVVLVILLGFTGMIAKAQDEDAAWGGQGTKVVNVGYGVGSIWKTLFKLTAGFNDSKTTAVGPYAIGFEYGVSEKIGVGVQLGYGSVKNVSTDPGANSNGGDLITKDELKSFQVFARGNYHFGESAKFDPYLGLGLGYGNFKLSSSDNDANYDYSSSVSIPSAFIYSGALGAKYYFTSNIGVYAEIGYVTGSYFQGGIAIKF